ncbi:MAG: hypothetical protein EOM08_08845, partial [Clostridia bacterium]|nr:hypothetical protein [Clostridia bacterium]
MITIILSILTTALISYGSYQALVVALGLPRGNMHEAIRNLPGKVSFTQKLEDLLLDPIAQLINKLLPIGEYKLRRIQSDLDRLERKETPQAFLSTTMARSLLLAAAGIIFIPLGIPWLTLIAAVTGVLAYFRTTQDLHLRVAKVNRQIARELPRLVESLNYA